MSDHTTYATEVYQRARGGIGFGADEVDLTSEPEIVSEIDEFCDGFGNPRPPHDATHSMNVYFHGGAATWGKVINYTDGKRAMACIPWMAVTSTSVLAHELGHSLDLGDLSPRRPDGTLDPVSAVNVMNQHYTPALFAPHSRLLPGQVFRVLMSDESWILLPWLGLLAWQPVRCPGACPPQRLDVAATP